MGVEGRTDLDARCCLINSSDQGCPGGYCAARRRLKEVFRGSWTRLCGEETKRLTLLWRSEAGLSSLERVRIRVECARVV